MVLRLLFSSSRSNKRALSTIVSVVLLTVLVVVSVAIVWGIVQKLIEGKINDSEACFGVFDKVTLDDHYTCYNYTSKELQIAVDREDIELDELIISIAGEGKSETIKLTPASSTVTCMKNYQHGDTVILPNKSNGFTYFCNITQLGFTSPPNSIKIVPVIKGTDCGVSDSFDKIESCSLLV